MITFKHITLSLIILSCLHFQSHGTTVQLTPSDSVQTALDQSSPGDEIILAPGVYTENLIFPGHDLTLRSTEPTSTTVVDATIIRGLPDIDDPIIKLTGQETSATLISGLTITGAIREVNDVIGGGIEGNDAEATIQYNHITENQSYHGGGIGLVHGLIYRNRITNNHADREGWRGQDVYYDGGGIYGCDGEIRENQIVGNTASRGGGIAWCLKTHIVDNYIADNSVSNRDPEAYPRGGGLYICTGLVEGNTISGNSAWHRTIDDFWRPGDPYDQKYEIGQGGGVYVVEGIFRNNVVVGNIAAEGGGAAELQLCEVYGNLFDSNLALARGGGIYKPNTCFVVNNIFTRNNAVSGNGISPLPEGIAGAIYVLIGGEFSNNLLYGNTAENGTGAGGAFLGTTVRNNISWNNQSPLSGFGGITGSNIVEGYTGDLRYARDIDPQFVDAENGDFRLKETSPLIDAGYQHDGVHLGDIDGNLRLVKSLPLSPTVGDGSGIDIGPYEYQHPIPFSHSTIVEKILLGIWSGEVIQYDKNSDGLIDSGDLAH